MKHLPLAPNRHSCLPAELYPYNMVNNAALPAIVANIVAKAYVSSGNIVGKNPSKIILFPAIAPGTTTTINYFASILF